MKNTTEIEILVTFTGYVSADIMKAIARDIREDGVRCSVKRTECTDENGEPKFGMSIKIDRPIAELIDIVLQSAPEDVFASFYVVARQNGRTTNKKAMFYLPRNAHADA